MKNIRPNVATQEPIAIIGMSCRLPGGVSSPSDYWRLLSQARDGIGEIPESRWDKDALFTEDRSRPGKTYVRWGGFLEGIDQFDPEFFGISPREAAHIDPQQRLLLEVAYEALEDAGLPLDGLRGSRTGVYVGMFIHDYAHIQLHDRELIDAYTGTGTSMSIAANRISYLFDLKGPSLAVDTACSSSLVALHQACESLRSLECNLVLAGGVNAILRPEMTVAMSKASMLSPDGRCHSFDAAANGYVRAEGAGMVALKRLADALRDGDRVHAILRSTALNQDGRTKGISVPNGHAQEALVREAHQLAGVSSAQIQYVEAHGTGTPVGDPIEATALGKVLAEGRPSGSKCIIGSVKSNIGHTESASGIAGLLKVVLSLKHQQIPANLHFREPNPKIDFDSLKLRVPVSLEPWPETTGPRLACLNSFGFGGTNAHAVVQEAPPAPTASGGRPGRAERAAPWLIPLSGQSETAARAAARNLARLLSDDADSAPSVEDVAFTAGARRTHHAFRIGVIARSQQDLIEKLDLAAEGETRTEIVRGQRLLLGAARPAFIFSGMGPQWWKMGRELLDTEPVFQSAITEVDELFQRIAGWSIKQELLRPESESRIQETRVAQPGIFAVQVGLFRLWNSLGVQPGAIAGHSVGEAAAAHAAGILSLEDAVRVIFNRSRLQHRTEGQGRMLAVGLTQEQVRELLHGREDLVSIAAINSPKSISLAGDTQELEQIEAQLVKDGVFARFLQVPVPYHSPKMNPLRSELLDSLAPLRPRQSSIPYYSTILGELVRGSELDAGYWWRNVRDSVLFGQALERMIAEGFDTFVELGPHPVLARSIQECLGDRPGVALASLKRNQPEQLGIYSTLAELYCHGCPVDFRRLAPQGQVSELPPYPWQRERYWDESKESEARRLGRESSQVSAESGKKHPLLGVKLALAEPTFQNRLSSLDYVDDHRVRSGAVFPGAGYLEMASAAAARLFGTPACTLSDVRFDAALFWPSGEAVDLETTVSRGTFEIHSRNESARAWTAHMSGVLAPFPQSEAPLGKTEGQAIDAPSVADAKRRLGEQMSAEVLYPLLQDIGLDYGPAFQGIERVWRERGEAVSEVRVPESGLDLEDYAFHPALLDACLHTLFCTLTIDGEDADMRGDVYLPVAIRRFALYRPAPSRLSVHCILRAKTENRSFEGDVFIYDAEGDLVASAEGLRCQNLNVTEGLVPEKLKGWLYDYRWEQKLLGHAASPAQGNGSTTGDRPRTWLLCEDQKGVAPRVAELLRRQGDVVVTVSAAEAFSQTTPDAYSLDWSSSDQVARLLASLSGRPLAGVVYLAGLDTQAPSDSDLEVLRRGYGTSYGGALHVYQALRQSEGPAPRLWLVTGGAFGVVEDDTLLHPEQAPLWGFARVLGNEQPEFAPTCVDLSPSVVPSEIDALVAEILTGDVEDEVALRGTRRFVHRFGPAERATGHARPGTKRYQLELLRKGSLDGIAWREAKAQPLGVGEVEVEVRAVGLNFKDVMKASGLLPASVMENNFWQRALGMECSGVVTRVGANVSTLAIGDPVFGFAHHALASHVVTDARFLVRKPAHLSHVEAATIPLAFGTAYYALIHQAHLREGESVLIHAASGGVGQAALQLARRVRAHIFATAGSPAKRDFCKAAGATEVMDSRSLTFATQVMDRTAGAGVDVILNSLAGDAIDRNLDCLAHYGRFLELGKVDIDRNHRLGMRVLDRNASLHGIDLDRLLAQRPETAGQLLSELAGLFEACELDPLTTETFSATNVSDAFRYMAGASHIGKVVISFEEPPAQILESEGIAFRPGVSYLITGGFGGFGLELLDWLVTHGARHLVVLSRSGPTSPEAQAAVARLKDQGVTIQDERLDLCDSVALARVISELSSSEAPLRGVFHAAAILDDDLLRKQTLRRFEYVAASKLEGAWLLHHLTRGVPLDHFVLFSSITSVLGNHGSGNYVAANAFIDALAHSRRRQGQVALTVNWGLIANVGMAQKEPEIRRHLEANGLVALHTRLGLAQLAVELSRGTEQVTISSINWERWLKFHQKETSPRFSPVSEQAQGKSSQGGAKANSAVLETLWALPSDDQPAAALALVRERVARIFGAAPEKIDGARYFTDLGLDSLMALELRGRLEEIGLTVTVSSLLEGSTVQSLTARLLATRQTAPSESSAGHSDLPAGDTPAPSARSASEKSLPAADSSRPAGKWIVTPHVRDTATLRLFCFPYAGGAPTAFHDWGEELPADFEVSAINLPGRGKRIAEPARGSINQMAEEIVAEMLPLLDRPFSFFGHCMGSIIMYEVAMRLQQRHGLSPVRLFAGGSMAPHLYQSSLVYTQPDPKFMDVLRLLDFTNTQAMLDDPEMRALLMPTLRADFEAVVNYSRDFTQRERLRAPITGFAAKKDLFAAPSSMTFWKDYTQESFDLWMLDVHHYFVETHRLYLLRRVAADLSQDLERQDRDEHGHALAALGPMAQPVPLNDAPEPSDRVSGVDQWVARHPARRDRRVRLYCFPTALGRQPAEAFVDSALSEHAELCILQLPETPGARPSLVAQAKALAEWLLTDIDGPFAFFGHCSGAVLMYEVAQALRARGGPEPAHLFASSAAAPDLYVMPNAYLLGDDKTVDVLDVIGHPLTDALRKPGSARREQIATIRADFEMMATYAYRPAVPLTTPITALRAKNDLWTFFYGMEAWAGHTTANFEIVTDEHGDHFHVEKDAGHAIGVLCRAFGWGRTSEVLPKAVERDSTLRLEEVG